jgi:hypothetical protein
MSRISYRPWQRSQHGSKDNFRIHFQDVICDQLIEHHSAAFTMDQYSDLWPQALEGLRLLLLRFSRVMVAKWQQ